MSLFESLAPAKKSKSQSTKPQMRVTSKTLAYVRRPGKGIANLGLGIRNLPEGNLKVRIEEETFEVFNPGKDDALWATDQIDLEVGSDMDRLATKLAETPDKYVEVQVEVIED